MRILIISFHFPPYNTIGAVRVGKTAKYLQKHGHEVKVITAANQKAPKSLVLEIAQQDVRYTSWFDINRLPERILDFIKKDTDVESLGPTANSGKLGFLVKVGRIYTEFFNWPDSCAGWYGPAVREATQLIAGWHPDMIYASSGPVTSLLIGSRLSNKFKIPWVAELRDLWTANHYREFGKIRTRLDLALEKRTLNKPVGLVTVSEPLAALLRRSFGKPVKVVLNGYDQDDFEKISQFPNISKILRIVYTGRIYEGKRDPSPLFAALKILGSLADNVQVEFYGSQLGIVQSLAQSFGVEDSVRCYPPIPYKVSLEKQSSADILLLLLWNDPKELGVYTGKLFEYIGSRRPILTIGSSNSVAASLITENKLGFVENDAESIANLLRDLIEIKSSGKIIEMPSNINIEHYSRETQTKILDGFLKSIFEAKNLST